MSISPSVLSVEFSLPAETHRDGEWWIASCPDLDVCSQGRTRDEALVNLEDAVVFFVESCVERGTIFEVLHEAGFERIPDETSSSAAENHDEETISVRVPLPFRIGKRTEQQRAL